MTTGSKPIDRRIIAGRSWPGAIAFLCAFIAFLYAIPAAVIAQDQSRRDLQRIGLTSVATAEEATPVHFTVHIAGIPAIKLGNSIRPAIKTAWYQEPYELLWDFGDGTPEISSGVRPSVSHTFEQQGDYTVTVRMQGSRTPVIAEHSRVISIKNTAPRISGGIAALELAQAPRTFEFTSQVIDTPKDALTYTWSFGDGAVEEGVDLWRTKHRWPADGHYQVTLRVRDEDGGQDSASAWVKVGNTADGRSPGANAPADESASAATTSFVADISGSINTEFRGHIEPMTGLYLNSIRPGVCRFTMTAWDPTQLANITLIADMPNLRPGGVRYRFDNPDIHLSFQKSAEIYRDQKYLLAGGGKMGAALSGLSRLTALLEGTPTEITEGLGVNPDSAPGHAPDLRKMSATPPFGGASYSFSGGTLEISVITHDRAEGDFNVTLADTRRNYLPLAKTEPPLRSPVTLRGKFTLNLLAARGQGMVRYQDCMTDRFAITETWPEAKAQHQSLSSASKVTFGSPYDPDTLNETTFKVGYFDMAREFVPIAGRIVRTEQDASFTPAEPLLDGVRYEARITTGSTGVRGLNGEPLEDPDALGYHAWTFSTRVRFDSVRPGNQLACHVFQTVRDAPLIKGKPTVARVYADWAPHAHVSKDDQVTSIDARAGLGDSSTPLTATIGHKFIRSDLMGAHNLILSRRRARHTANLFGWMPKGNEGSQIAASLKVETTPDNWEAVYATRCPAQYWNKEPHFRIDYYTIDGLLAPEESSKTDFARREEVTAAHHAVYQLGEQYALQLFPLQAIHGRSKGVMKIQFPEKLLNATAAMARRRTSINSQISRTAAEYARKYNAETDLVLTFFHLDHNAGGLMMQDVWEHGPGTAYMGMDADVESRGLYAQGWVHEVGHALGLEHIPFIDTTEEQSAWVKHAMTARASNNCKSADCITYDGIEGFRIAPGGLNGWNKSSSEGNAESNNLAPLMLPAVMGIPHQFIATHHYHQLQDTINRYLTDATSLRHSRFRTAALTPASWMLASGSFRAHERYVSVGGIIGKSDEVLFLGPMTRVPEPPREEKGGAYTMALLDAAGGLVASSNFAVPPAVAERPVRSFSASIRWTDSARSLVLLRGSTVIAQRDRTANPPQFDVLPSQPGDREGSLLTLNWTASGSGAEPLMATILYSPNGLDEWSTKALWLQESSFTVDTSTLEPGPKPTLRVMISDGFDEVSEQVAVEVSSGLRVLSALPTAETTTDPLDDIALMLNSGLTAASVRSARATLREGNQTATKAGIHYDANSRLMRVVPESPIKPNTRYQATVDGHLEDAFGNRLKTPYIWSFTTATESK